MVLYHGQQAGAGFVYLCPMKAQPLHPVRVLVFAAILLISNCTSSQDSRVHDDKQTLILISIDGMRYDYPELTATPTLDRLADSGVQAASLIPVFPSKTFPNHYSQVTGLYPENHGIVSNVMWDPVFEEKFYIGDGSIPARDGKWYGGEPMWVTAEKQGLRTATCFWPGADAEIQGVRPTYYRVFDSSLPYRQRIDIVTDWLATPPSERPSFITLYFETVDGAGHATGPASADVIREIEIVDHHIGDLLDNIEEMHMADQVNIIVVSDHGMSRLSRERVIFLDDYINLDDVDITNFTPIADMSAVAGKEALVYDQLRNVHPQMTVFRKGELPEELHYNDHRRIQPLVCIASEGWSITTHAYFDNHPGAFTGGAHGYTPDNEEMHGIFFASGPAFKQGEVVSAFECVHLYALMCQILRIEAAENDGNLDMVVEILAE